MMLTRKRVELRQIQILSERGIVNKRAPIAKIQKAMKQTKKRPRWLIVA